MRVVSLGPCCSTQQAVGMAPRMQRYNSSKLTATGGSPPERALKVGEFYVLGSIRQPRSPLSMTSSSYCDTRECCKQIVHQSTTKTSIL